VGLRDRFLVSLQRPASEGDPYNGNVKIVAEKAECAEYFTPGQAGAQTFCAPTTANSKANSMERCVT